MLAQKGKQAAIIVLAVTSSNNKEILDCKKEKESKNEDSNVNSVLRNIKPNAGLLTIKTLIITLSNVAKEIKQL